MKWVTFFNIGAYTGETTKAMIDLFKELELDYRVFQFEPLKEFADMLDRDYKDDFNVHLIRAALSNQSGNFPIYRCGREDGSSLHATKWDADKDNFEMVECKVFSEWYKENVGQKADEEIYIMKCSINGGEFEFFSDLINSGINKTIDIYCGKIYGNLSKLTNVQQGDVEKFKKYLSANGINEIDLTCYTMHNMSLVKEALMGLI